MTDTRYGELVTHFGGRGQTVNHTPMTAAQATHFDRYSAANVQTVKSALHCGCEPYKDVFTYRRWQALGYQVQKGQKSIKIPIMKAIPVTGDTDPVTGDTTAPGSRTIRGTGAVFCRCQVQPITG